MGGPSGTASAIADADVEAVALGVAADNEPVAVALEGDAAALAELVSAGADWVELPCGVHATNVLPARARREFNKRLDRTSGLMEEAC